MTSFLCNLADDTVYMSDEQKLEEYVLNDSGCLFQGQARQIGAVPWFFGQVLMEVSA